MPYLRLRDYQTKIQTTQLNSLISNGGVVDHRIRITAEERAQTEAISFLSQKYETAQEFKSIGVYALNLSYNASDCVYLDGDEWTTAAYDTGVFVTYQNYVYLSIAPSTNQPPSQGSIYWQLIGQQYDEYYVKYPQPLFDIYTNYKEGDQVFWKDKVYTCKQSTSNIFQDAVSNPSPLVDPPVYIFPDTKLEGTSYWDDGVPFALQAGILPTDTVYWALGDIRNPQLVGYVMDIAIYYLHQRIAPQNVPAFRIQDYNDAKDWFMMAAKGLVTAALPKLQPNQGSRIRIGSDYKNFNKW